MNFIFEWQKQYFTNERSEWVKYCFCHEKIKFISSSRRVMFFLLYRPADESVFDDFPKISDHLQRFPKIFQNFSEGQTNVPEHFSRISENFRKCPKIAEDCRRLSRKTRRCFDDTLTNLSTIKETNLISMKSSINSRVRLWKINYSGPGCSFYEFYEWYIFQ